MLRVAYHLVADNNIDSILFEIPIGDLTKNIETRLILSDMT